jgi:ABC-type antimicrobial peptide transport system permease subunit
VGAGVLAGLALALPATRLLRSLLFGTSPSDPETYAAVALLLGAVAALACLVPARRATRVDPMTTLRCE